MKTIPKVLTIAGSDSSAGAGIQADLKTFMALNVYGTSAITSITVQNTQGIESVYDLPGFLVYNQIKSIISDIGVDATKTGMLSNSDIIESVASAIHEFNINKLIVDPVLKAKDETNLLKENAINIFKQKILPEALIITPNIFEAEILSDIKITSREDMILAAEKIYELGPKFVVIKGGHLPFNNTIVDLIYSKDKIEYLENPFIQTKNTHGIGCTFSAAITAYIAKGFDVFSSIKNARAYIQNALQNEIQIGNGFGPLNHGWLWQK